MLEEANLVQLFFKLYFFLGRNVLERGTVGTKVQANEFHDTFATHDIAAEVADNVYNLLAVVLQGACRLQISLVPRLDDSHQILAIIIGSSTYAASCASHSQTRQNGLVLTVQHVVLAIFVKSALVIFVQTLEGVFDAGKVRDASVNSLEELYHRQEGSVEGRDVVEIEG